MTFEQFRGMVRITITNPRQAGAEVIALGLPSQALWIALMLVSVILSLLFSALVHSTELPPDEMGEIIRASLGYRSPLLFAVINWVQAVVSVFVLHWTGRMFGGQGGMADMLAVMIWLQIVSLLLAVSLFVIGLVLPLVGVFLMLCAFFWGLWATVGLVDAANRFGNMFKAAGVCVVAVVVFSVGMTVLLMLMGDPAMRGV